MAIAAERHEVFQIVFGTAFIEGRNHLQVVHLYEVAAQFFSIQFGEVHATALALVAVFADASLP